MINVDSSKMEPEELKEIRKGLGLSIGKMSSILSLDRATISRYESGKRSIPGPFSAIVRIMKQG